VQAFSGRSPGGIALFPTTPDAVFNGGDASRFFDTVYL
jgi:hypothetical protein